jgi:hypothetical protein
MTVSSIDGSRELSKRWIQRGAHALKQALRPSNDELDELTETLEGARLLTEGLPTLAMRKRFVAGPTWRLTRDLMDTMLADSDRVSQWERLRAELEELATTDFAPPPLITGDDLTAAGLTPGPVFKRVLDATYDAQLEGRVMTKEQALHLALDLARGAT